MHTFVKSLQKNLPSFSVYYRRTLHIFLILCLFPAVLSLYDTRDSLFFLFLQLWNCVFGKDAFDLSITDQPIQDFSLVVWDEFSRNSKWMNHRDPLLLSLTCTLHLSVVPSFSLCKNCTPLCLRQSYHLQQWAWLLLDLGGLRAEYCPDCFIEHSLQTTLGQGRALQVLHCIYTYK